PFPFSGAFISVISPPAGAKGNRVIRMGQTNFINAFAGFFKATAYAFGCANGGPPALTVHNSPILASTTSLALAFGYSSLLGSGDPFYPLATNAPISVGAD